MPTCSHADPTVPLLVRMRMHANDLHGDGCWRELLNEAADEIELLTAVPRRKRPSHNALDSGGGR